MPLSTRHIMYITLIGLAWGGSFYAIHVAVAEWHPAVAAFFRVFFAALIMWGFVLWRRPVRSGTPWVRLQSFFIGWFSLGLPFLFLFWGEQHISAALAAILNSTTPLFVVAITPLLNRKEIPSFAQAAGVCVGFLGVFLIFLPEMQAGVRVTLLGCGAVLIMAIFYAISILWTRRITHQISAISGFAWQTVGGVFVLSVINALFYGNPFDVLVTTSWRPFWAVAYLAIFSTALAWIMFFALIKERGAVSASTVTYIIPIVAIILDFVLEGRMLSSSGIVGSMVILFGVYISQGRLRRRRAVPKIATFS